MIAAGMTVIASEDEGAARGATAAAPQNTLYAEECGSCHLAYPPALLPAQAWRQVMSGLSDHFGENAELAAEDAMAITDYLETHAGGSRLARSVPAGQAPLRITGLPRFKHEHDELPASVVAGNAQVKSFSNCDACHTRAAQGSFREREIRIPGYPNWED
jgi:hypothetical protein